MKIDHQRMPQEVAAREKLEAAAAAIATTMKTLEAAKRAVDELLATVSAINVTPNGLRTGRHSAHPPLTPEQLRYLAISTARAHRQQFRRLAREGRVALSAWLVADADGSLHWEANYIFASGRIAEWPTDDLAAVWRLIDDRNAAFNEDPDGAMALIFDGEQNGPQS